MSKWISSLPGALASKLPISSSAGSSSQAAAGAAPAAARESAAAVPAARHEHRQAAVDAELRRPPPLDPAVAQVIALAAAVVVGLERERDADLVAAAERETRATANALWLEGICAALKFDPSALPSADHLRPSDIEPMQALVPPSEHPTILHLVLLNSIFPPPSTSSADPSAAPGDVSYSATARRRVFALARLLALDPRDVVREEERVAADLFDVLKRGAEAAAAAEGGEGQTKEDRSREEVERVRKEREEGWGGKWGRWAATGAGVVIGSVALGLTGGLAAPAILALLPMLGFLTPAAAPVVLGTLFGLTGGGLAGRRVRRRWGGVGEFEFVELGKDGEDEPAPAPVEVAYAVRKKRADGGSAPSTPDGSTVADQMAAVNLDAKEKPAQADSASTSLTIPPQPPSLTAVIALPGLLTQSADEGVLSWRAVACAPRAGEIRQLPLPDPTTADGGGKAADGADDVDAFELPEEAPDDAPGPLVEVSDRAGDEGALLLRGRDVFVARIETAMMLESGSGINAWITDQLIKKAGQEVLKRTFINAYMSAVALPLTVYGWAGTALDNTWMRAVDKAKKAGPLLAEILLSRTQGARPVQLVGHSLGAVTVLHALLTLASSPQAGARDLVDSAILISLPASPSPASWRAAKKAIGRRLVNAWSGKDFVLASVVRLHEVIGNAVELRDGARVGGLSAVDVEGVENVDLSTVVDGHFQITGKLPDILRLIDLDA